MTAKPGPRTISIQLAQSPQVARRLVPVATSRGWRILIGGLAAASLLLLAISWLLTLWM